MTDINRYAPRKTGKLPIFVSAENGCEHRAHNPDNDSIRQFKLDGEVFPLKAEPQRCDFLLLNDTKKTAYFIELKGTQAKKAIEQIETSIGEINPSIPTYKIFRRIITRRGTHGIQQDSLIRWKKQHRTSAKAGNTPMIENI